MIRKAVKEDCINLAVLSLEVWLDTYAIEGIRTEYSSYVITNFTEVSFLNILNNSNNRLLVCESNKVLKAFVLINFDSHFECDDNGFEIEKLYVDKRFKAQGIGRKLLAEVESRYGPKFWLYTWVENKSNNFYKHLGFKNIGKINFDFNNQIIENNVYAYTSIKKSN
ncbi:MAG: GNAT family N-acetyltransferase [Campylobacteraceae bacterium]|nr:GNAT family N-acetyltransferase [Campylobacteraceae bacterium]